MHDSINYLLFAKIMNQKLSSLEEVFMVVSDPSNPGWIEASTFLSELPKTAQLVVETLWALSLRVFMKRLAKQPIA